MIAFREKYLPLGVALFVLVTLAVFVLCVCMGSVMLAPGELWDALGRLAAGDAGNMTAAASIMGVRIPRVLCAALMGAALALCGAAMQGLLRNPLADGSTLGVSSGAALGAVLAIALGVGATMLVSVAFAFLSLLLILFMAQRIDRSLATNTIILIGVIFSMFASAVYSIIVTFAGERLRSIVFWSMGSLTGANVGNVAALAVALLLCGAILLAHSRELNAFSIGEDNARHLGVNVRRVKLVILVAVAVLIGVSVSIGGTIGFVGLVIPHITRTVSGANHKVLLPMSVFGGAVFLMLCDLAARTVLQPRELPIGVVTALIGAVVFVYVFARSRRRA
jgi:iron complex transport system permease protein